MNEERVESGRYLRALREHWPYILATVALAVGAAAVFVQAASKRYEAGTDVLVTPVPADTLVGIPLFRESDVSRSVVAAARIVTSPEVVDGVKERLHLQGRRRELLSHVTVAPQEQSSILTITGKGSTAEEAARIANAFADVLLAQRTAALQREVRAAVARLTRQIRRLGAEGNTAEATALAAQVSGLRSLIGANDPTLQVASRAVPPESAAWPRPVLTVGIALLAGLLLGMGIAIGIELLSPLVLAETDVLEPGGPPILARVPRTRRHGIARELLQQSHDGPARSGTTPYRALWANVAARTDGRAAPASVLVTSADRSDQRVVVTVALALTLALAGRRVVVVDADTRSTAIASLLDVRPSNGSGLRAVLIDDAPLDQVLAPSARFGDRLRVLGSQADDEALLGVVGPERIEALAGDLERIADVVLVAAASPADAPDVLALAEVVDAVVVTVELGRTQRARVSELRRDLAQRAIIPAGFVVIERRRVRPRPVTPPTRPLAAEAPRARSGRVERERTRG